MPQILLHLTLTFQNTVLTLLPFLTMCLHKYIGATGKVSPVGEEKLTPSTFRRFCRFLSVLAAPIHWCKMVSSTNVYYKEKWNVSRTLPVHLDTAFNRAKMEICFIKDGCKFKKGKEWLAPRSVIITLHLLTSRPPKISLRNSLKGQGQIFCFWFFSWISFPQASDYNSRAVSNFFENSRRYSQLMAKTFKQKNFNNFVWTPLGSRVNIYINFCLQVHFKLSAAWYCCHCLPPVSMTPAANLPPVSLIPVANLPPVSLTPAANLPPVSTTLAKMVEKFATGVADTGGKFTTGVVDTGGNFAAGVVDTGGAPWLANISANFRKISKRSKWNTLELGGNWFMKKTRSKKSCDTVPLNKYSAINHSKFFLYRRSLKA